MSEKIVQTAGREQLGEFAPMFAHLNDDVLFGEVWNEEAIDMKTKCIITVVSLMASGITDSSLTYHLQNAKAHGVTKEEIAAIITHATMYVGWPKGWAVFRQAKEVWNEMTEAVTDRDKYQNTIFFPIGEPNDAYAQFFVGQSYLAPVSTEQVSIFNVTFEPGCRNNWHIHHAKNGGGQMLICIGGRGYYQEWGKEAVEMTPGKVINIPAEVKHWHGAAPDSWFSHLAIEVAGEETSNEWLEAVSDEDYGKLKQEADKNEEKDISTCSRFISYWSYGMEVALGLTENVLEQEHRRMRSDPGQMACSKEGVRTDTCRENKI